MEISSGVRLQASGSCPLTECVILREAPILHTASPARQYFAGGTPPYLASTAWLQGRVSPSALKTRDFTRTHIESNHPEGMMLTVPVVGGSSATKRMKPEQLEISDHGDWTRIHLGAIEAAYGKEPYFVHLFPEIAHIIDHYPQHLATLCVLLMKKMLEFIGYREAIEGIKRLRESNPARCHDISRRLESKIDPTHSFLEPLFRFGTDSIFLLPLTLTFNS
ncbi:MAG: WbqC family protein [Muribaculaceae bacterium]|nr:WbqC family protein [Muribaculaceae bacterium]